MDGSDPGYPDAGGSVWLGGTFSIAYAERQNWAEPESDAFMTFITSRGIPSLQNSSGGFPVVASTNSTYGWVTSMAVAGASWSIFTVLGRGIWMNCPN